MLAKDGSEVSKNENKNLKIKRKGGKIEVVGILICGNVEKPRFALIRIETLIMVVVPLHMLYTMSIFSCPVP